MTYPLIGNYGRLVADDQSMRPWLRGLVVAHATAAVLDDARQLATMLRTHGIPAIAGIDTRALARHLRSSGCLRGIITAPGETDPDAAVALARAVPRWEDQDFVAQVSPAAVREVGDDPAAPLIAIVDFGLKANIVNSLRRRGVRVRVLPHTASADGCARLGCRGRGVLARSRGSRAPGRPRRPRPHRHRGRAAAPGDLPRAPDRGPCGGRRDQPPPVRAPRGQPPGPGPGHGLRPGDGPEPRGPGGGGQPAARLRLPRVPGEPQRPVRGRPSPRGEAHRDRPVPPRRRSRARSTRSPCSTGSWPLPGRSAECDRCWASPPR